MTDDGEGGEPCFAFIDVESGVPALFPLNPVELFRFYLPASFRHGHALFDDVDVQRLREYLRTRREPLEAALGRRRLDELQEHAERLDHHQQGWWGQTRRDAASYTSGARAGSAMRGRSGTAAARCSGGRAIARAAFRALTTIVVRLPTRIGEWVLSISVSTVLRNVWQFVSSQAYRTAIGRRYVRDRIREWRTRGQLERPHACTLLLELRSDEAAAYLSDFGAHLGMKATFQLLEFTLFGALVAARVLPVWVIPVVILLDGLIYRTA